MILMGFAVDALILYVISPEGFFVLSISLILAERLIIKSIINDPNKISLEKIVGYVQNYQSKYLSLTSSQLRVFETIFRKENIGIKEISDNVGLTIIQTKRLVNNLMVNGYIIREDKIYDGY